MMSLQPITLTALANPVQGWSGAGALTALTEGYRACPDNHTHSFTVKANLELPIYLTSMSSNCGTKLGYPEEDQGHPHRVPQQGSGFKSRSFFLWGSTVVTAVPPCCSNS